MVNVIVIGAGAAGLMCAAEAGKQGHKVLLLDKANKPGKKILMSGGGRCNFTNLDIQFDNYLSHNPHFMKSALSCYTQWDFIKLMESYGINYEEKKLGQLFCVDKAKQVVDMLMDQCTQANVTIKLKQSIVRVYKKEACFYVDVGQTCYQAEKLIIASGGLSIPTMGASGLGYELAKQFGLNVYPVSAGLVPFTTHEQDKERFAGLSGVSIACQVSCNGISFIEDMLFTHRGLSGPAMLQISSYWMAGKALSICLLPDIQLIDWLKDKQKTSPELSLKNALGQLMAKRIVDAFIDSDLLTKPLKQLTANMVETISQRFQNWQIKPNSTEGYRTAEVTLGGVNTDEVSSKTFEAKRVPGLYFIGEVLDVTGWLGGYNFQWAWSSAKACAKAL